MAGRSNTPPTSSACRLPISATSSSAAACLTAIQSADAQVESIKKVYASYKDTINPTWVQRNLPSSMTPATALTAVGNNIFGQTTNNTPPFAAGVSNLQTEVTTLAAALNDPSASGMIAVCASAVSAQVAASDPGTSPVLVLGAADGEYFANMQSLINYYTTYALVGQQIAGRGAQMAMAVLAPSTITSAAKLNAMCVGQQPSSSAADLSCPGLLYNLQATLKSTQAAVSSVGASWGQVSNGLLESDSTTSTNSDYMIPAQHAWVTDLARYGMADPFLSSTPAALSSVTGAAGGAAADLSWTGTTPTFTPTSVSWLGLPFTAATTAAWNYLLPIATPTSTQTPVNGVPLGTLMAQSGLANGGQSPTDLILLTGETSPFNWSDVPNGGTAWTTGVWGFQNFDSYQWSQLGAMGSATTLFSKGVPLNGQWPTSWPTTAAASFLDTNTAFTSGSNPVLSAPSGSSGTVWPGTANMTSTQTVPAPDQGDFSTNYRCNEPSTLPAASYPLGLAINPSDMTNAPNFYGPLSATVNLNMSCGGNELTFTPDPTGTISTAPAFLSATTAGVSEFMWPVAAAATACPQTSFSQGTDGNAGVTNTCQTLFNAWLAAVQGITTGPVSVDTATLQPTQTSVGNYAAQVLLTNSSGAPQSVTLDMESTVLSTLVNVTSGGATISGCTSPAAGRLTCTANVPSGASTITVPLTGAPRGGTPLYAAVSGPGMASFGEVALWPYATTLKALPAAVTNLTAVPSTTGTATTIQATFTVPSSSWPLTGYTMSFTNTAGQSATVSDANNTLPGTNTLGPGQATVNVPVPAAVVTTGGLWTFTITPINAAGQGIPTTTTVSVGSAPPPAPTRASSAVNTDGTVTLTWAPVAATPAVTNYTVTGTSPTGGTKTVETVVPSYTVPLLEQVGTYTFTITAQNSVGVSPPTTLSVPTAGGLPKAPLAVSLTVDADGWFSAAWTTSNGLPTTDTYYLALYGPGATDASAPEFSEQITVDAQVNEIRLPAFYRLGKASPAGTWIVAVTPANSLGVGPYGAAQVQISAGTLSRITAAQAEGAKLAAVPRDVLTAAKSACAAGNWTRGMNVFGTCTGGVFTAHAL